MNGDRVQTNWRAAQAEHHWARARLLRARSAAYAGEANTCPDPRRRAYLRSRARQLQKEADLRAEKAAELSGSMSKS